jgi:hypothetical protein
VPVGLCATRRHRSTIDVRHTRITDHDVKHLVALARGKEFIDSLLSAIGRDDGVSVGLENLPERLEYEWIIIHQQNPQRPESVCRHRCRADRLADRHWKAQSHRGSTTWLAFNLEPCAVAFGHAK